jgi:hypothetical protein
MFNTNHGSAAAHTLDRFAGESDSLEGISLQSLEPGTVIEVETKHSHYQFLVLDRDRKRVLVTGGAQFPERTEMRLEGASFGGSAVKAGWICVGLRLELSMGHYRVLTSRVQSIDIESLPPLPSASLTS